MSNQTDWFRKPWAQPSRNAQMQAKIFGFGFCSRYMTSLAARCQGYGKYRPSSIYSVQQTMLGLTTLKLEFLDEFQDLTTTFLNDTRNHLADELPLLRCYRTFGPLCLRSEPRKFATIGRRPALAHVLLGFAQIHQPQSYTPRIQPVIETMASMTQAKYVCLPLYSYAPAND